MFYFLFSYIFLIALEICCWMILGEHLCIFVVVFFLKNAEIFKMKFIVILKFFLLILMAVRNIKQTIMKDYNIQSFCQPFLFCTTFILYSALSIIFFTNFWQKWLLVHWLQIIRPLIFRWTLYQADISIKQTL